MEDIPKVIVVEGNRDKKRVKEVLDEEVNIICTNGTVSYDRFEQLVEELAEQDVYLLFDRDFTGDKLRKKFKQELQEARCIYIDRNYGAVECAALEHLGALLTSHDFIVHKQYQMRKKDGGK